MFHNRIFRQFHRTWNRGNTFNGLGYMFFDPWASPYGTNGQMRKTLHNCKSGQIMNFILRKSLQQFQIFTSSPCASPYGSNGQRRAILHVPKGQMIWCCKNILSAKSGHSHAFIVIITLPNDLDPFEIRHLDVVVVVINFVCLFLSGMGCGGTKAPFVNVAVTKIFR